MPSMKVNLFRKDYIQIGALGHKRRKYSRRMKQWRESFMEYSSPFCSCCFTGRCGVFMRRTMGIFGNRRRGISLLVS